MTNTHINVGGHKITTNKVGQVHTLSAQAGAPTINWVVTNGICHVYMLISSPTAGSYGITGFPKAKINAVAPVIKDTTTFVFGLATINVNSTTITLNITDYSGYCSISYPVADDWVES